MYFNRKHGAAQDRPAIFLHYSSSVSISSFVPSRNRKCRSRRRGLPRSPTIEIICFLPSGTKRLFFRSEKQKRSYRTALFPLLPFFNFSVYYHAKLHIITETHIQTRKLRAVSVFVSYPPFFNSIFRQANTPFSQNRQYPTPFYLSVLYYHGNP